VAISNEQPTINVNVNYVRNTLLIVLKVTSRSANMSAVRNHNVLPDSVPVWATSMPNHKVLPDSVPLWATSMRNHKVLPDSVPVWATCMPNHKVLPDSVPVWATSMRNHKVLPDSVPVWATSMPLSMCPCFVLKSHTIASLIIRLNSSTWETQEQGGGGPQDT
jgi:hypothetical protein